MDGIRVRGLPQHSPLTGEMREDVYLTGSEQPIDNNDDLGANNSRVLTRPLAGDPAPDNPLAPYRSFQDAQFLGNVLQSDRSAISLAGMLGRRST